MRKSGQISLVLTSATLLLCSCGGRDYDKEAKVSLSGVIHDPTSVLVRNVREGRDVNGKQMLCGEVNGKNTFGGYSGFRPFVAIVGGPAIISTGAYRLNFDRSYEDRNAEAMYQFSYDQACASPEERRQYAQKQREDAVIDQAQRAHFDETVRRAEKEDEKAAKGLDLN